MSNTYSDRLKTPAWKEKRQEALERDDYTCQACGSKKMLQVHHMVYSNGTYDYYLLPWDTPLHLLITLCAKCHESETYCRDYVVKMFLDELKIHCLIPDIRILTLLIPYLKSTLKKCRTDPEFNLIPMQLNLFSNQAC